MKILIYDCEILRAIPDGNPIEGIAYCEGWQDFQGMGVSVIGYYASWLRPQYNYLVIGKGFTRQREESRGKLLHLINQADWVVGFNSISFDDNLVNESLSIPIRTHFDLLREVRIASHQPPRYVKGRTRKGYALKDLARVNLNYNKSASGELAPVMWQQGRQEEVIRYCLNDVQITKNLYDLFINNRLIDPTNGQRLIYRDNWWEQYLRWCKSRAIQYSNDPYYPVIPWDEIPF
jgi:DEAD/DEAH box helicase domain-containing protein